MTDGETGRNSGSAWFCELLDAWIHTAAPMRCREAEQASGCAMAWRIYRWPVAGETGGSAATSEKNKAAV